MCRVLRNTDKRGRSVLPSIRLRIERWRFFRLSFLLLESMSDPYVER
jgi:hypothetical protein